MSDLQKRYLQRMSERILRMKGQLAASSWDELKSECHQVKGSAATYGFEHLSEIAREAEQDAISRKPDSIRKLIVAMEKQIGEQQS